MICFIPEELFVTVEMAEQSPIVKFLDEKKLLAKVPHYERLFLQLLVMQERRNPTSKLSDFLEMMPKFWTNFPVLYNKEEMAWLEGSMLAQWTSAELKG